MRARFRSWWQQISKPLGVVGIIAACVLVIGLIVAIIGGYHSNWEWTGFNSGTSQITIKSTSKVNYTATIPQPSKTLWDWLQLLAILAIPVVVGIGAAWFTTQQGKVADAENTDNQRETALQAYIDKISELILNEHLAESPLLNPRNPQVETIARARTVTVLRILDPVRRGSLIRFLSQGGILAKCTEDALNGIDLHGANLTKVNLSKIDLRDAFLRGAFLRGAEFGGANLREVDLTAANLRRAHIAFANLRGAFLWEADLRGAFFGGANLSGATLKGAFGISIEELKFQAKSLKGAIMPDGTIHP